MKKTLLFYFYFPNDYLDKLYVYMHFYFLKKYSILFDKVVILLGFDDFNPILVNSVKHKIIETIRCRDLEINVVKNESVLRDAYFFKKYFIDELDKFEGLVFFGHSKGGGWTINNTFKWVNVMYYYNLEFIDDVVNKLSSDDNSIFYGTFKIEKVTDFNQTIKERLLAWYAGTYFWMNVDKLKRFLYENNIDLSNYFKDKFSVEKFPGEIFGSDKMRSLDDIKVDFFTPGFEYFGDYNILYDTLGHKEEILNSFNIMMNDVFVNFNNKM